MASNTLTSILVLFLLGAQASPVMAEDAADRAPAQTCAVAFMEMPESPDGSGHFAVLPGRAKRGEESRRCGISRWSHRHGATNPEVREDSMAFAKIVAAFAEDTVRHAKSPHVGATSWSGHSNTWTVITCGIVNRSSAIRSSSSACARSNASTSRGPRLAATPRHALIRPRQLARVNGMSSTYR